jgi:hypothetical protein
MDAVNYISVGKDVVLGLSALAVAIFAWLGLKTWRKELTGKAKFEIARNMMRLGFELKDAFGWVRHPFTRVNEYADRPKQDTEAKDESQIIDEWYAKGNRLRSVAEILNKIIEAQWEAECLLEENSVESIKDAVKSYRESYADLYSAITTYFQCRQQEIRFSKPYKDQEWLEGLHPKIYAITDDEFSKKVEDATERLSSTLKEYVR